MYLVLLKPFLNPQKTNGPPESKIPDVPVIRPPTARFDPLAPGALVMPRPDATHQVGLHVCQLSFICIENSCASNSVCSEPLLTLLTPLQVNFDFLQFEHNKRHASVVDVVIDPHIAHALRPHQREGVKFLYECVMGMRGFLGNGAILA